MIVDDLIPQPKNVEPFKRARLRFVPERSGCYVLASFSQVILYVGLATSLRSRMINHLDSPEKTEETKFGRATLFFWLETSDLNKVERSWMNVHIQREGKLPILNTSYSPVRV